MFNLKGVLDGYGATVLLFADAFLGGETDFIDGRVLRMIILRRVL